MKLLRVAALLLFVAGVPGFGQAGSEATPAWMNALAERHAALIAENGPGTDAALGERLLGMLQRDQAVRAPLTANPAVADQKSLMAKMVAVDAELTGELKTIVAKDGWPTIGLVGYEASNAAMIVLIHTEDHAWQRSLLGMLQKLVDTDKIAGDAFATMVDKERVSEGKAQVYGTQFKTVGDGMMMYRVENAEGLAGRRKQAMLMPIDVYKGLLASTFHSKVVEGVAEPAKTN